MKDAVSGTFIGRENTKYLVGEKVDMAGDTEITFQYSSDQCRGVKTEDDPFRLF